ncbi:MAG: response regulator [Pseudomonadota bacterium]
MRALLIEDEENILEAIRFLLSRDGWDVMGHGDGATALEAVARIAPDVVVLDVMLPGRSGLDILRDLRAKPETADLPVLMLTAKGGARDRDLAFELGANAFLSKPFANAEMVETMQGLAAAARGTGAVASGAQG